MNFVPRPELAVAEMRRVTVPGGIASLYVWDFSEKMELIRHFWDAAVSLDSGARELHEAKRYPLCKPEPLKKLFESVGFNDVAVRAIDVITVFKDFDDYWSPFLGGQGPAPAYAMSLKEGARNALRDNLRASLPIASDGSISLIARAWAIKGVK